MNTNAVRAIYSFEMARMGRSLVQSVVSPVLSTALYFVVFGSAIGSRMKEIDGVGYAAFIVPGMILLTVLNESISNASFGIYHPRFSGAIYEILAAPVSAFEIVVGYVGAAATKSVILGVLIFTTARLFVSFSVAHPILMFTFFLMAIIAFCLLGFIVGLLAENFEQLQILPVMVTTPLTFLGGSFYSIHMLPEFWQKVSLFNPIVYLVSGFRWAFYGIADVRIGVSIGLTLGFIAASLAMISFIFDTGYKIKQ